MKLYHNENNDICTVKSLTLMTSVFGICLRSKITSKNWTKVGVCRFAKSPQFCPWRVMQLMKPLHSLTSPLFNPRIVKARRERWRGKSRANGARAAASTHTTAIPYSTLPLQRLQMKGNLLTWWAASIALWKSAGTLKIHQKHFQNAQYDLNGITATVKYSTSIERKGQQVGPFSIAHCVPRCVKIPKT